MKLYLQHIVIIETDVIILPQLSKECFKSSTLWKKREVSKASENEQIIQSVTKLVEALCPEGHISYFFDTVYFNMGNEAIPPNPLEEVYLKKENCTFLSPHPLERFGCVQTALFRKVDIYTRMLNSLSQVLLTLSVNVTRCFFVFCYLLCYYFL